MKFRVQQGIGSSKYTVSKHDGESLHKDGSEFWDIAIFKSKKKMNAYISSLLESGYKQS